MKKGLPLTPSTIQVIGEAIPANLRDMAFHGAPSLDLPVVVWPSSAHVVATVPLKPSARILVMNPSLLAPVGKRLGRLNAEEVERRIVLRRAQLGFIKPIARKLVSAVRQVSASENAQKQHLFGRQLRTKPHIEVLAHRFTEHIRVV